MRWKLIVPVAIFGFYAAACVVMLQRLGVWSTDQLKDTLLWWAFSGVAIAFSFASAASTKAGYWRRLVGEQFGLALLAEWLSSTYTLPLWTELILVPALVVFGGAKAYAEVKTEYAAARRPISYILTAIGVGLFAWSVSGALHDMRLADLPDIARDIGSTVLLSVLAVPFGYVTASIVGLEDLFVRARFTVWPRQDKRLARHLAWSVFKTCQGDRSVLDRMWRIYHRNFSGASSREHIDAVIALMKTRRRGVRPDGSVIPNPPFERS